MCKKDPKGDQNTKKNQSKQQIYDELNNSELIPKESQIQLEQISQSSNCSIPRKMNKKISKKTRNPDSDKNSKITTKKSNSSYMRTPTSQKVDICGENNEKKYITLEQFQLNKKKQIREVLGYHKRIEQMCNIIDKRIILTSDDPIIMLMKQDIKIPERQQYKILQQQQQELSPLQLDIQNNQVVVQSDSPSKTSAKVLVSEDQNSSLREDTDESIFQRPGDDELDEYQLYFKSFVYSQEEMSPSLLRLFLKRKQMLKSDQPYLQKVQAQLYNQYYHGYSQHQFSSSPQTKTRIYPGITEKTLNIAGIQIDFYDDKSSESEKNKKKVESHICFHCWEVFENGFKLGGHTSKKHPGKSLQYENRERLQSKNYIDKLRRQYFQKIKNPSSNKKWQANDEIKAASNSNAQQNQLKPANNLRNESDRNKCKKRKLIKKSKASTKQQGKKKIIKRKVNQDTVSEEEEEELNVNISTVIELCDLGQNLNSILEKPIYLEQIQQQSIMQCRRSSEFEMEKQTNLMEQELPSDLDLLMEDVFTERPINYTKIYNDAQRGTKGFEVKFFN